MRVIAAIQVLNGKAIKTIEFQEKLYLGDPINIARILSEKGTQEIALIDIGASKSKFIDFKMIKDVSEELDVPLVYGGGINKISDIDDLMKLGVDRVVTSNVFDEEGLSRTLVDTLGASSVALSIDIQSYRYENEVLLFSLRNRPNKWLTTNDLKILISRISPGDLILRPIWLDGSSGEDSVSDYAKFLSDGEILSLRTHSQLICGCGVRTIKIADELDQKFGIDGVLVGSLVSLTSSQGVLIQYPSKFSIKSK